MIVFNIVHNWFLHFHNVVDNDWFLDNLLDLDDSRDFNALNFDSGDDLRDSDYSLMVEGDFNFSFNYFLDLFDERSNSVYDSFNFSYLIDRDKFFPYYLYLSDLKYLLFNNNYLLNNLWYFQNLLHIVVNNDDLLNNSVNDLDGNFHLNVVLFDNFELSVSNYFLNNFLNFDNLGNVDNSFNDFLGVDWDFNNSFNNSLDWDNNLLDDLYLSYFDDWFLNDSLDFYNLSLYNNSFDNLFNFYNFGNFNNSLYHFFNVFRDLFDYLYNSFDLNKLLHNVVN